MIIELEYYNGNGFLFGKSRSRNELQGQLNNVERIYDRNEDNFTELLVRMYGWTMLNGAENPDYTYDKDIGKLFIRKY